MNAQYKSSAPSHVRINGEVLLYEVKAPYTQSGVSIAGALEYDPIEDRVKCHECGEWFKDLAAHAFGTHQLSATRYKTRHGLQPSTALINERLRRLRVKRGFTLMKKNRRKMRSEAVMLTVDMRRKRDESRNAFTSSAEFQNTRRVCHAQLLERLREVAQAVGHTPTQGDLREYGLSESTLIRRFGSRAAANDLAKLLPQVSNHAKRYAERYSAPLLRAILQDFVDLNGYVPTRSDIRRNLLPAEQAFEDHFGTFTNAIRAAGLTPQGRGRKPAGEITNLTIAREQAQPAGRMLA